MPHGRHAKGALTVAAATAICHTLMSAGYAWARDGSSSEATPFAGAVEFLLTTAASWVLMPLLLWAGMRAMRETGTTALVVVAGLTWVVLSGYFMDDIDRAGGHVPLLALAAFVLLGTALAGIDPGRRRRRSVGATEGAGPRGRGELRGPDGT